VSIAATFLVKYQVYPAPRFATNAPFFPSSTARRQQILTLLYKKSGHLRKISSALFQFHLTVWLGFNGIMRYCQPHWRVRPLMPAVAWRLMRNNEPDPKTGTIPETAVSQERARPHVSIFSELPLMPTKGSCAAYKKEFVVQ
jgi:hypothetical protein